MADSDGAVAEGHALQCLLDAFPSAPLEIIASAFLQANSDTDLARELISFSLSGISSRLSSEPPSSQENLHATTGKDASVAKRWRTTSTLSHGRPLLCPQGPCPPTLEEFFPKSLQKNAWLEPLTDRLQRNVLLQERHDILQEHECRHEDGEFPSLEARPSKEKYDSRGTSGLPASRSEVRNSSRASAAFGLASNVRSRSCKESTTKSLRVRGEVLTNHLKQLEINDEENSLWPTETEAALLSMLGDQFDLDIETVRDILGHYEGDVEKSFEALSQSGLSSSRSDHDLQNVAEFKIKEEKDLTLPKGAGVHEGLPISEEKTNPPNLAKVILEALFSKPQENNAEIEENHKHTFARKEGRESVKRQEIPEWKAVTSTELDISGGVEGRGQVIPLNMRREENNGEMSSYGDWDSYDRHHASAKEHWKTMQSYLKAATAAFADSDFSKAEILTEKAEKYKQLSMEAKERANSFLLEMKSQENEGDFTLDLQEQHVAEALQLLRLHLKSFSSIPSCHMFTVKTGCQEDRKSGHVRLKQEIVGYLQKKGYTWVETSPFCLQIHLKKDPAAVVNDERI